MTLREEVKDPRPARLLRHYPPDPTSIIFFLKNRMRDKYRDVHKVENELHLKTSEKCRIQIRKDILELQAQALRSEDHRR